MSFYLKCFWAGLPSRWENWATSIVLHSKSVPLGGNGRLLLGMQSPLQTDGTTKKSSLVLNVFFSLIDVSICALSSALCTARGSEMLQAGANRYKEQRAATMIISWFFFIFLSTFDIIQLRCWVLTFTFVGWTSTYLTKIILKLFLLFFLLYLSLPFPSSHSLSITSPVWLPQPIPYQLNTTYQCNHVFARARLLLS